MTTTARTALGLGALTAQLVLAACSGGSGPATLPAAAAPSGGTTTAPTAAPVTAGPGPTAAPTTAPSTTASAGLRGGVAGPAPCAYADLRVTSRDAGGAAGSVLVDLVVTNRSSRTCTVTGYPGLSWAAGSDAHQVGAAATRTRETYRTVVLPPSGSTVGHARFAVAANYPASRCRPVPVAALRVFLPGQTRADMVPFKATACSSTRVDQLEVRPLGAR